MWMPSDDFLAKIVNEAIVCLLTASAVRAHCFLNLGHQSDVTLESKNF